MSGTSGDGIDAALVEIGEEPEGNRPKVRLRHFRYEPYRSSEREAIVHLNDPDTPLTEIAAWHAFLGERFGKAVRNLLEEAGVDPRAVAVVGSHGQSVAHHPEGTEHAGGLPFTVQIGDPARIAVQSGIGVVSDFRARDVALGGQGAPLVPYFDHAVFSDDRETRVLLNIGGIANITVLPAGGTIEEVRAFDTGPGNMVLDRACQEVTGGARTFDSDGDMARAGRVNDALVGRWLMHPFFRLPPPKSTGREAFGQAYTLERIEEARELGLGPEDTMATLTALVARSIGDGIRSVTPGPVALLVAGGGIHNRALMDGVGERLNLVRPWERTDAYGIPADAKEAVAFAYFAWQFLKGRPTNVPSATGAREAALLGHWTPPPVPREGASAQKVPVPSGFRVFRGETSHPFMPTEGAEGESLRFATEADAAVIAELLRSHPLWQGVSAEVWTERVRAMLEDGHIGFLAVTRNDPTELRGVLLATDRTFSNCGYVRILAVRQGETSQGIGASLMAWARGYFAKLGRKAVFLLCTDVNEAAQRFYTRLGYRRVGSLPDWLSIGRDEWLYVLRIDV